MRKACLALAISLAFLFSMIHVAPIAAPAQNDMGTSGDAGDSMNTAATISAGTDTGYFDSSDADDYYKIAVSSGQTVTVSMTPPSDSDFDLYLSDTNQSSIDSSANGIGVTDNVGGTATASGYFYIDVRKWTGTGTYTMTVTVTGGGATQNDMGTGGDAGNVNDTATLISAGSGTGYLGLTDTNDLYLVSLSSGQTISVSMTPPSGSNFDIYLYAPDASFISLSNHAGSQAESLTYTAITSGLFYVRVYPYSGSGTYSMTITVTGGGTTQNDMGTGTDAGNSIGVATTIVAGSGTGYIDSTDTADYYKISVTSGQTISVSMTPPSGSDFDLYLYDPNQSQVDYSNASGSSTDTVDYTATSSGSFYIKVYRYSGSGTYSMTITVTGGGVTTQNDMGTNADAGNSLSAAATISPKSGTGYIDGTDTDDYYAVNVTSGQTISVEMTPPVGSDFDLELYNPSQSLVDSSALGGSQTDSVEETATSATAGYWYIRVYRYSGSGSYSMTVTITGGEALQNDMGTNADAGNSLSAATAISPKSGTGYIDGTDTNDYYAVNVTSGQTISVEMTPPLGSDFDLELYNPSQSLVDSSALGGSQTDSVEAVASSTGDYYIHVKQWSGSGSYSMTVTITGGEAPQNDMGTSGDAGNSISAATDISSRSGTGYIDGQTDTDDYYKISVSSGQTISVEMTPPLGSDFDLELYNPSQSLVDSSALGGSQTDSVEAVASSTGDYYIHVKQWSGSGSYSMTVTITGGEATQNDMGTNADAGNSISAAREISPRSGTGYINDQTDTDDYYKVNVSSGQTISVEMTPPLGSDFDLELYNPSQSLVDSSALGGSQTDSVEAVASSTGDYYIHVEQWSGSGIYSMTVTVTGGTAQNDANSNRDAGNTFSQALTIEAGSYTGFVDSTDTDDYYKLMNLSSGQMVLVYLTPPTGSDFDLYSYNPNQLQVASSTLSGSQTDMVSYVVTIPGDYYVRIKQWSGSGVYSFTIWLSSVTTQNDWNSQTDAGNNIDQALEINSGSGTGYLDSTDTDDYYKIANVASGAEISAILTPPTGSDFDLYLYNSNGSQVASSTLGGSQTDTINYTAASAGDWYIRVYLYSGEGTYSLQVSTSSANVLAESPHPYPNDYDQTWTISQAGAGKIRVHFTQLDVESNWDYVYIYDGTNNLITTYTGSYRDMWTDWVIGDTIKVRLVSDYSVTGYGFTIDSKETGAAPPPPTGNKFAILVGVNDYIDPMINDLVGCVEDAADLRTYLVRNGYQINYFLADRQATEANIKQAIANVVAQAGSDSTIVFAFSGHGAKSDEVGLPAGNSVICTASSGFGTDGNLTDLELRDAFANYQGRLMVFLDTCRSGGMNEVVTSNVQLESKRYMTTACTDDGYGFGIPQYQNGAWGYWFVDRGLVRGGSGHLDMEGNFAWAKPAMISDVLAGTEYNTPNNYPEQFDGDPDPANLFTL